MFSMLLLEPNTSANHIWHFVFMHILSIYQCVCECVEKKACSLSRQKPITETFFWCSFLSLCLTICSLDDNLSEKFKHFFWCLRMLFYARASGYIFGLNFFFRKIIRICFVVATINLFVSLKCRER